MRVARSVLVTSLFLLLHAGRWPNLAARISVTSLHYQFVYQYDPSLYERKKERTGRNHSTPKAFQYRLVLHTGL